MVKAVHPLVKATHLWKKASMTGQNTGRMVKAVHPLMAGENTERTMLREFVGARILCRLPIAESLNGRTQDFLLNFQLNSKLDLSAAHWWYSQWNLPSSHPPDDWPNLKLESSALSCELQ